ncbi:hypothetical protein PFICI_14895 [Pestalotiopsis fici W106-1]|uniref:Dienelactone hydrolase domain-containing protein n=1 Tax=Pestalotiopsis fici (strain W106-1 / CGMCC3.15140) TaxID=1229662 RepID=W3WHA2_PESFW|nr:uncharacterized protein PFICI_14895 [Pestalotiopsis fici W106-1]ETS73290.1 hypothetical protein PFICI_14895 [Pestalotiopsis fici W106-1]
MSTSHDAYLAQPSGNCCLTGTIHQGKPKGRFTIIAGIETYVSEPPAGKANGHVLLYFPDVWGMAINGLLIMDGFADAGFLVLGPDYFRGDPVTKHRKDRHDITTEPGFDFEAWKLKHTTFSDQAVPHWIKAVQEEYGKLQAKFACVGYCFGAPYVCKELAEGGSCVVGAFAHPAFLKESHFRNLTQPLFLSCSEIDHTFSTDSRNHAIGILKSESKKYHLQLFSGVEHGFALRGNPEDPYQRWVKEQSLQGIIGWLKFWLAQ